MCFSCLLGCACFTLACAILDELVYHFAMPDLVLDVERIDGKYVAKRGESEVDVEANSSSPSPAGLEKGGTGKHCCGLRVILQLVRRQKHKFRIVRMYAVCLSNDWKSALKHLNSK